MPQHYLNTYFAMWSRWFFHFFNAFCLKHKKMSLFMFSSHRQDGSSFKITSQKKPHGGWSSQKLACLQKGKVLGQMLWTNCASPWGFSYSSPTPIFVMCFTSLSLSLSFSFPSFCCGYCRKITWEILLEFCNKLLSYFQQLNTYWWKPYWSLTFDTMLVP